MTQIKYNVKVMNDLIILTIVIIFLGVLIRFKVNIGIAIFLSAIILSLLKGFSLVHILISLYNSSISYDAVNMILIVTAATIFADLLKESSFLLEIVNSFSRVFRPKIFIPAFSLIIGALYMPGGALVSAPLVEEGSKDTTLVSHEKVVINFWFRHVWEPISPLFPEVVLSASLINVPLSFIIKTQWPITLSMFFAGVIFILPSVKENGFTKTVATSSDYIRLIKSTFPILLVISLVFVFRTLSVALAILVGIVYVIIIKKISLSRIFKMIRVATLLNYVFLMIAIFFLKYVSIESNLIKGIYDAFVLYKIPYQFPLFFLPFIVGLMTGISSAAIGLSYPLLLPLMQNAQGKINPAHLFMAYLGVWTALSITPTHLCLSLSVDFFKAKIVDTYKFLYKNILFVLFLSIIWIIVLAYFKINF
jgi:integral membrane protein (TIGR00529 family)